MEDIRAVERGLRRAKKGRDKIIKHALETAAAGDADLHHLAEGVAMQVDKMGATGARELLFCLWKFLKKSDAEGELARR